MGRAGAAGEGAGLDRAVPRRHRRRQGPRGKGKAVEQARALMVDGRAKLPTALPRPALVTSEEAGFRVPAEETLEAKLNRTTASLST